MNGAEKLPRPRVVIVHHLDHVRAALAAADALGTPVIVRSAPAAAAYGGAGWFRALVAAARVQYPGVAVTAVLDCGRDPGLALAALREGIPVVRLGGNRAARARVAEIAAAHGAALDSSRAHALDLLDLADPLAACRAWLAAAGQRSPLQTPMP